MPPTQTQLLSGYLRQKAFGEISVGQQESGQAILAALPPNLAVNNLAWAPHKTDTTFFVLDCLGSEKEQPSIDALEPLGGILNYFGKPSFNNLIEHLLEDFFVFTTEKCIIFFDEILTEHGKRLEDPKLNFQLQLCIYSKNLQTWMRWTIAPVEYDVLFQVTKYLVTIQLDTAPPFYTNHTFPIIFNLCLGKQDVKLSKRLQSQLVALEVFFNPAKLLPPCDLSNRNKEVLLYAFNHEDGKRQKMALDLEISEGVLKDHIKKILSETSKFVGLEFNSMKELVLFARKLSYCSN